MITLLQRVRVNSHLSNAFPIYNGTKQGCLLSLYALTLKPMLNRLRANQNIRGVRVGKKEHKLSAYADNITLSDLVWAGSCG